MEDLSYSEELDDLRNSYDYDRLELAIQELRDLVGYDLLSYDGRGHFNLLVQESGRDSQMKLIKILEEIYWGILYKYAQEIKYSPEEAQMDIYHLLLASVFMIAEFGQSKKQVKLEAENIEAGLEAFIKGNIRGLIMALVNQAHFYHKKLTNDSFEKAVLTSYENLILASSSNG